MNIHRSAFGRALVLLSIGLQVGCGGSSEPVSLTMSIDPTTITLGQSATITWEWKTPDGGSCHASGAWHGDRKSRNSNVVTPTETGTLTYTLECIESINASSHRSRTMSVTLTVNAPAASASARALTTGRTLVDPRFAYVTNAFAPSVAVVDTVTNQVTATIDFPTGSVPFAAAMLPDLEKVYVTSLDAFSTCGDNTGVFVIDTASNAIAAGPIAVGCEPTGIAITPDGQRAYVASQLSDSISVIDTATDSVSATILTPDGGGLASIAISPDGLRAYATGLGQSPVLVIDITSNTVFGMPIDAGTNSSGIAISPNGALAYVANTNDLGSVTVIDTATNTVIATTALDDYPYAVAFTPDSALAYVTQAGVNDNGEFTVSMIDTASHAVVGSHITVDGFPTSIAITADGMQAYVGNEGSSTVSVIDTASNTVTTTLGGMNSPRGIAARPLPPPILVLVPDVVGATQAAATTAITSAGLVVGTVTQQASSTIARGSVISQDPGAGAQVVSGSAVSVIVSSGESSDNDSSSGGGGGGLDWLVVYFLTFLAALSSRGPLSLGLVVASARVPPSRRTQEHERR